MRPKSEGPRPRLDVAQALIVSGVRVAHGRDRVAHGRDGFMAERVLIRKERVVSHVRYLKSNTAVLENARSRTNIRAIKTASVTNTTVA